MNKLFLIFILFIYPISGIGSDIPYLGGIVTDFYLDLDVFGNYAYCASKYGLVVLDVSDKENPIVINRISTPGESNEGYDQEVLIADTLLFYCDGYNGLNIFSIAEPEYPVLTGTWALPFGQIQATNCELRGDHLYLSTGGANNNGMSIIDVSDPFQPLRIGHAGSYGTQIVLFGNFAYTTGSAFEVFNIEDPYNPQRLNVINGMGGYSIYNGMLANGLIFYDLGDPINPEEISHHFGLWDYEVIDNYVFYSHSASSGICWNIEDIHEPFLVSQAQREIRLRNIPQPQVTSEDGYLYTTYGTHGFSITDISDVENLVEVSELNSVASQFRGVEYYGDYLYVYDKYGSLNIYSTENDSIEPELINQITWENLHESSPLDYFIDGDYLYLSAYITFGPQHQEEQMIGMYVYSLENPENPELVCELRNPQYTNRRIFCNENLMILKSWAHDFNVLSKENPEQLEEVGSFYIHNSEDCDLSGSCLAVCISGRDESALALYQVDDPDNPELISRIDIENISQVLIYGQYAYVLRAADGIFEVYSLEDLENPRLIEEFPTDGFYGGRLRIIDDVLVAQKGYYGFEVFSLENPEHPELFGYVDTPDDTRDIIVKNDLIYVADMCDLGVYDISRIHGAWYLEPSADFHSFDSTEVGETATWELTLSNVGVLDRELTDLRFDSPVFGTNVEFPLDLSSHTDTTLTVTFTPLADSLYESSLTIHSGDCELHIPLSGRGYLIDNVVSDEQSTPYTFSLSEPYPNPFNSTATISYQVARTSKVNITIYDLSGRVVTTLQQGVQQPGTCALTWDAGGVPSGIYLVQMTADDFRQVRKVMLLR